MLPSLLSGQPLQDDKVSFLLNNRFPFSFVAAGLRTRHLWRFQVHSGVRGRTFCLGAILGSAASHDFVNRSVPFLGFPVRGGAAVSPCAWFVDDIMSSCARETRWRWVSVEWRGGRGDRLIVTVLLQKRSSNKGVSIWTRLLVYNITALL